ncbi:MAG: double-strand break repair helicase AddA, partial [Hellea sp.]|nr:double-strand break repair helicase AddA [Hellea sp.]
NLSKARRLFAAALETPEGLKVQTIHSFCEKILSRFPIEAGILPGFKTLNDKEKIDLEKLTQNEIYQFIKDDSDSDLCSAIQFLSYEKKDLMDTIFEWAISNEDKVKKWELAGGTNKLADILDVSDGYTKENLLHEAYDLTDWNSLVSKGELLLLGEGKYKKIGEKIIHFCKETNKSEAMIDYLNLLLKKDRSGPYKSLIPKNLNYELHDFFRGDNIEAQRIFNLHKRILSLDLLKLNQSILLVSKEFLEKFKKNKLRNYKLDFQDQILMVRDLLKNKHVSDWVKYKLDGGIEHILLDEAQDTSENQWEIIDALNEAFITETPDQNRKNPRTLFAVGDEKQSIYSFQGAEPEIFLKKISGFLKGNNNEVRMQMSFRSAPEILEFVDQVFVENGKIAKMFDDETITPELSTSRHMAHRTDRGQVEIWPLTENLEVIDDSDPWDTKPVDELSKLSSKEHLAKNIALRLKKWIDSNDLIYDRLNSEKEKKLIYKPLDPGDVMILVRKRGDFFKAIIKNLKTLGIPVAGADRLTLQNIIVVKDMISLAKFTLLQSDDLSLAEVLKGPLFSFSEEMLFEVSFGREKKGTLWKSLKAKRPEIAELLTNIISASKIYPPYEFFSFVLNLESEPGSSFLRKIYLRLGIEAKDALEEFLAQTLEHQRLRAPSLQYFVHEFISGGLELKREMSENRGKVRVMTVHGAKGLEAPVVILPDTTGVPKVQNDTLIPMFENKVFTGFYKNTKNSDSIEELSHFKESQESKVHQEYLRQFYVALTRAESRLIVCGYMPKKTKKVDNNCWYKIASNAFEGMRTFETETTFGTVQTYGKEYKNDNKDSLKNQNQNTPVPKWCYEVVKNHNKARVHVSPSKLLADKKFKLPTNSPLSKSDYLRFNRGNLIHKLLEILPDVEREKRLSVTDKVLQNHNINDMDYKNKITSEVFEILDNPIFSEIFSPGSKAEVSIIGAAKNFGKNIFLNAQIDRISVTDDKVFITDYKTNVNVPEVVNDVPNIYLAQLASYRELVRGAYPKHEIVCSLLWTNTPKMMIIDGDILDTTLTQLNSVLS